MPQSETTMPIRDSDTKFDEFIAGITRFGHVQGCSLRLSKCGSEMEDFVQGILLRCYEAWIEEDFNDAEHFVKYCWNGAVFKKLAYINRAKAGQRLVSDSDDDGVVHNRAIKASVEKWNAFSSRVDALLSLEMLFKVSELNGQQMKCIEIWLEMPDSTMTERAKVAGYAHANAYSLALRNAIIDIRHTINGGSKSTRARSRMDAATHTQIAETMRWTTTKRRAACPVPGQHRERIIDRLSRDGEAAIGTLNREVNTGDYSDFNDAIDELVADGIIDVWRSGTGRRCALKQAVKHANRG